MQSYEHRIKHAKFFLSHKHSNKNKLYDDQPWSELYLYKSGKKPIVKILQKHGTQAPKIVQATIKIGTQAIHNEQGNN
jgi:hypothetical protein